MSEIERYIAKIEMQLLAQSALKAALAGFATGVFSMVFTSSILAIVLVSFMAFVVSGYFLGLYRSRRLRAIQVMHRRFPDLEFSLELLDKPNKNIAEQLQWERVNAAFRGGNVRLWQKGMIPFLIALVLASGVFGLSHLHRPDGSPSQARAKLEDISEETAVANLPIEMVSAEVNIFPPAYTGLSKSTQSELEIRAIKGSEIEWVVVISGSQDIALELIGANGDGLEFQREGDHFVLRDRVRSSGIYALRASQNHESVYESGYYTLEAVQDLAPVIQPTDRELYRYHFADDPKTTELKAKVSDDFKVKEVFLVATLARGSGENVKFRENRILIPKQDFRSEELTVELDLDALDFREGDELYYYWAAMDNKTPEPNFSRSDTYFINYVDSTGIDEQEIVGMAIHVMPEYFRSQRQIIIDTEKLIDTKGKKPDQEFNSTSNEIGSDQKLLRLRYGQYLGEENSEVGDGSEPVDFLAGHDHDHAHEGGITEMLAERMEGKNDLDSTANEVAENAGEDGLGGLMNAFLNKSQVATKAKIDENSSMNLLKLALDQMWESELHLRLFEPEKALPFQNKALEYLKAVQQKSRVYVKRTGFDPPPLRQDEKRLTGELEDLKSQIEKEQLALSDRLAPLAAQVLGMLPKQQLSTIDRAAVQKFGELWTVRMNYTGLEDWSVLLQLQALNAGKITEEGKKELFQKLYPLVVQSEGVNASSLKQKELEKAFWNALQ